MSKMQSDFSTAEEIATKMKVALDHIQNTKQITITNDTSSNLWVVKSSGEIETMLKGSIQKYNDGLTQVMSNIKSVAKDFEETDIEAKKSFEFNDVVKDTSTYGEAINGK